LGHGISEIPALILQTEDKSTVAWNKLAGEAEETDKRISISILLRPCTQTSKATQEAGNLNIFHVQWAIKTGNFVAGGATFSCARYLYADR